MQPCTQEKAKQKIKSEGLMSRVPKKRKMSVVEWRREGARRLADTERKGVEG